MGQTGLFLWLTGFAVLVRAAMTLYHVPHLAMGAELSNDYHERTSIVAWRTMLAVTPEAWRWPMHPPTMTQHGHDLGARMARLRRAR